MLILGFIVLVAAGFLAYNMLRTYKALNEPRLADNYFEDFEAGGTLEAKFAGKGSFDVKSISVGSSNKSIGKIYICYPAVLESGEKQYPLVMIVNGSQSPAKTYLQFFERLASWGVIVVGNDDPQPGTGSTASETLDYVLNESVVKEYVDQTNMGLAGYSQGGAGAINAATKFSNSDLYKTLFTGSAAYPVLAASMGWAYEPDKIAVDYFMTGSTGNSDDTGVSDVDAEYGGVSPLSALIGIYNALPDDLLKVRGRCVGAEHGDMLQRTEGYMTAWMLWELCGDQEAAKVFFGENAEILHNDKWQNVEKNR